MQGSAQNSQYTFASATPPRRTMSDDLPILLTDDEMGLDLDEFEQVSLDSTTHIPVRGVLGDSDLEGRRDGNDASGLVYVHTVGDYRREVARIAYRRGVHGLEVRVERSIVEFSSETNKMTGLVRFDSWEDDTFWMELSL